MLFSQFPLTCRKIQKGMSHFIAYVLIQLIRIVNSFRLKFVYIYIYIYISPVVKIRSSLSRFHGFQLFFFCTNRVNLLNLKQGSNRLVIVFSTCVNLLYLLYATDERLSSASDETKLLAKNFFKNPNLDDSGIFVPVFHSITNLKVHSFYVTPKLVKKVITNLDSSKASGPDYIRLLFLRN